MFISPNEVKKPGCCHTVIPDGRISWHRCNKPIFKKELCKFHTTIKEKAEKRDKERLENMKIMDEKRCPTCGGIGWI